MQTSFWVSKYSEYFQKKKKKGKKSYKTFILILNNHMS